VTAVIVGWLASSYSFFLQYYKMLQYH